MKKSFRYRLYPTKNQEVKMERTRGICRYTYNNALSERIRQSNTNKLYRMLDVFPWGKPDWISYNNQASNIKTSYQEELHSQVYQNVLKELTNPSKDSSKVQAIPGSKEDHVTTASHIHNLGLN